MHKQITITVAGTHRIVCDGLPPMLEELRPQWTARSCWRDDAAALVAVVAEDPPDVLVIDVYGDPGVVAALPEMRRAMPEQRILVCGVADAGTARSCVASQCSYVPFAEPVDRLVESIARVFDGEIVQPDFEESG
jgi:DNA-binding NarL/FixJ family response regulator